MEWSGFIEPNLYGGLFMNKWREDRTFLVDCLRHTLVILWPPDAPPFSLIFRSNAGTVGFSLCMRSIWVP